MKNVDFGGFHQYLTVLHVESRDPDIEPDRAKHLKKIAPEVCFTMNELYLV
jgi:hypothetical protein